MIAYASMKLTGWNYEDPTKPITESGGDQQEQYDYQGYYGEGEQQYY